MYHRKHILFLVLAFFVYFFLPTNAYAANFTASNVVLNTSNKTLSFDSNIDMSIAAIGTFWLSIGPNGQNGNWAQNSTGSCTAYHCSLTFGIMDFTGATGQYAHFYIVFKDSSTVPFNWYNSQQLPYPLPTPSPTTAFTPTPTIPLLPTNTPTPTPTVIPDFIASNVVLDTSNKTISFDSNISMSIANLSTFWLSVGPSGQNGNWAQNSTGSCTTYHCSLTFGLMDFTGATGTNGHFYIVFKDGIDYPFNWYNSQQLPYPLPTSAPTNTPTPTETPTPTPVPTYTISGDVYVDKNENGNKDLGEDGYADALIELSNNQSAQTDSNGHYVIANVVTGTYDVILAIPQGYFATTTNPRTGVVVGPNVEVNFGITTPHAKPSTSITLAPAAINGEYPNPVRVTLSATADTGYSIAHTYYTIDTDSQQEYTAPFTVSGAGPHTIHYWSVDNANTEETPHPSTPFTISSTNSNGYIDPNSGTVTIGNGISISGNVTSGGYVTVVPSANNQGGPIPSTFKILNTFYNITSTASFEGNITLTFEYPTNNPNQNLKVLHYNGSSWDQLPTTSTYDTQRQVMILTVTTPSLSPFAIVELHEIAPTTTATLATLRSDGTYSNPTTVTLSATAEEGYIVENTYYTIDGGEQQTYAVPFTVSGSGEHTITYWSVDNSGLAETAKTQTFTIYLNQAPDVDPFSGATIDRGQTFTASSFFTDPDSSSWSATVDYADGAGDEPLTLNPDKTFSLNHQYTTEGTYQVRVVVRDAEQATGTVLATVTVVVPNPVTTTFNSSADTYVRGGADNRNIGAGVFMRLQASGTNRSLVRFDQTALQNEIGSKQVLAAKLRVTIVDNANNWGTTGRTIDAHRILSGWTEGNGTEANRGTGAGATWECAVDSIIENQSKNCSGTTEWEMGQPNNPSVHPWVQTATATQTITNNQSGVIEFDVTSDVQAYMNGTSNNGWIIKKTEEGQNGQVSFGTKESSSVPQLVITYQP